MLKVIIKVVMLLLITILIISSYLLTKQIFKEQKEEKIFDNLEKMTVNSDNFNIDKSDTEESENNGKLNIKETEKIINQVQNINLKKLYEINSDIVGWIKIDGTNINYPVMQNSEYYLNRDFYKNYSKSGTPFLSKYCNIKTSDNLTIYGHHMSNNTMFSALENYKNEIAVCYLGL